jgi:hypothetical protein
MSSSSSSAAKKSRDAAGHQRRSKQHSEGSDKMVAEAKAPRERKKSRRYEEGVLRKGRGSVSPLTLLLQPRDSFIDVLLTARIFVMLTAWLPARQKQPALQDTGQEGREAARVPGGQLIRRRYQRL